MFNYEIAITKLMYVYDFYKVVDNKTPVWEWFDKTAHRMRKNGVGVYNGATRAVIDFFDEDFVIKIQLDNEVDWNRNEAFVYKKAKERGVATFFAKCELISIQGITLLLAEKCDCDANHLSSIIYDKKYQEFCLKCGLSSQDPRSKDRFEDEVDFYAFEEEESVEWFLEKEQYLSRLQLNILLDFCAELHVTDLHVGNWGFLNNRIVIIDYAAYDSDARYIEAMRIDEEEKENNI